jgi:hypothetical protein
MFYFVKNKTKAKMIRKKKEEKQHKERRKRKISNRSKGNNYITT